jgi:hypothetical protein
LGTQEISAHGFRSTASILLHALCAAKRNKVKAAYNQAEYLSERTTMMKQWSSYIESQNSDAQIVLLSRAAA